MIQFADESWKWFAELLGKQVEVFECFRGIATAYSISEDENVDGTKEHHANVTVTGTYWSVSLLTVQARMLAEMDMLEWDTFKCVWQITRPIQDIRLVTTHFNLDERN